MAKEEWLQQGAEAGPLQGRAGRTFDGLPVKIASIRRFLRRATSSAVNGRVEGTKEVLPGSEFERNDQELNHAGAKFLRRATSSVVDGRVEGTKEVLPGSEFERTDIELTVFLCSNLLYKLEMQSSQPTELPDSLFIPKALLQSLLEELPGWNLEKLPALSNFKSMLIRAKSQSMVPSSVANNGPNASPILPNTLGSSLSSPLPNSVSTSLLPKPAIAAPEPVASMRRTTRSSTSATTGSQAQAAPAKTCDIRDATTSGQVRKTDKRKRQKVAKERFGKGEDEVPEAPEPSVSKKRSKGKHSPPQVSSAELSESSEMEADSAEELTAVGGKRKRRGAFTIKERAKPTPVAAGHILGFLASADTTEGEAQMVDLLRNLIAEAPSVLETVQPDVPPSVYLAALCFKLESKSRLNDFHLILALVQLRLSLEGSPPGGDAEVAQKAKIPASTLGTYKAQALGLRCKLANQSVQWADIMAASERLKVPDSQDCWGKAIINSIIPVISRLHNDPFLRNFSFGIHKLSTASSPSAPVPVAHITFGNIGYNDKLCEGIKMKSSAWNQIHIVPAVMKRMGSVASVASIQSTFVMPEANSSPVNAANRKAWTAKERNLAEKAEKINNLEDLAKKMGSMYIDGRKPAESYIRFSTKICDGHSKTLTIKFQDGSPCVVIATHLRAVIGDKIDAIPDLLNTILGESLVPVDTRSPDYQYDSLNLSIFNRFSQDGEGAPTNEAHPNFIQREHVRHSNDGQRLPTPSKAIMEDRNGYESLVKNLTDIYLVENIQDYVQLLPGNARCPFAPFGGIVINLGGCSPGHCDDEDDGDHCVVIPFMRDCKGGALVLHEPGLVLDLEAGDMVIFPSARLTHFNLHFQGVRASLVFHTDKSGAKRWRMANHWTGKYGVQKEGSRD
ncbi:hypothetical protein C8R43DRAFT_943594 [Mycena crocata]|nr:hypothetical protein C8R43DRAFT_943594 [Mycena crocata]